MKRTRLRGMKWLAFGNRAAYGRYGDIYAIQVFSDGVWGLGEAGHLLAIGQSPTPMRARLDAVAALRRELGLLPERAGWQRLRDRAWDDCYFHWGLGVRVHSRWGQIWTWEMTRPPYTSGGYVATPEAAAEAAEKALGVKA